MTILSYNHVKVAILWLLLGVCFSLHNIFHLSALFFGVDIKLADADGTVPNKAHLFRILIDIFSFVFVLLSLYVFKRLFYWISFVWAALLSLANCMNLVEMVIYEWRDYSQVLLLTLILAINILLLRELWILIRSSSTPTTI